MCGRVVCRAVVRSAAAAAAVVVGNYSQLNIPVSADSATHRVEEHILFFTSFRDLVRDAI